MAEDNFREGPSSRAPEPPHITIDPIDPREAIGPRKPTSPRTAWRKEREAKKQKRKGLRQDITLRQICCMALGSSIGAGILVASGIVLLNAGSGFTALAYAISGAMIMFVMGAIGETSTSFPVKGAFYDHSVRFISPAWGFAMGWNYVVNWLIVLPFELTILAVKLQAFAPHVNIGVFIAVFLVVLTAVALAGAKTFAEVEHWAGLMKATALSLFIFIAIAIITRGIPGDPRGAVGTRYWHDPGAFLNGLQGFLFVFSIAGVSYGGSEVVGLTAAECQAPKRMMPLAVKLSFVRILVLSVGTLLMASFVVPANDPTFADKKHGAHMSPFTRAMQLAHLPMLATFYNVVIAIAVMSMANTAIYASSRALQALCEKRMGPRIFARIIDFRGLPIYSVILAVAFGSLAFVSCAPQGEKMFMWLLSIVGLSNYLTWASILVSQIRFRKALAAQGREASDLLWRNPFGIWGSYIGLVICVFGALAPLIRAFWPMDGKFSFEDIIRNVIPFITALALWLGYYVYYRRTQQDKPQPWLVPLTEVDLHNGLRSKETVTNERVTTV